MCEIAAVDLGENAMTTANDSIELTQLVRAP